MQTLGDICSMLLTGLAMDLQHQVPKVISDHAFQEALPGGRRYEEIIALAKLVEDWAAHYLGRRDARELSERDIEIRRWRIAGLPEDKITELIDDSELARVARRDGLSNDQIKKLISERRAANRSRPS